MKEFLFTLMFFGVMLGVTILITGSADNFRCHEIGNALNYKVDWHYWTGCVVEKPDGSKVLLKQMRDFDKE